MSFKNQTKTNKCPDCEKEFEKITSLSIHYRSIHKKTAKQLYVDLFLEGIEPTCDCGCSGEVKFLSTSRGFRKYIRGHVSRVKGRNNFVTEKAQQNSANTRRKMIKEGTWKPFHLKETGEHWGSGLTKETDERIARMAAQKNLPETKKFYAKKMSDHWKDGTIVAQHGKNHSQWKGGVSPLTAVCHSYPDFYKKWKRSILEKVRFSCTSCGKQSGSKKCDGTRVKIEVHHPNERMAEIIRKIAIKYNWELKQLKV